MNKERRRIYTDRQIDEIVNKATAKAIEKTVILATGYLVKDLDFGSDKVMDFLNGVSRYADAVRDHSISLKDVCDTIKEKTGVDLRG